MKGAFYLRALLVPMALLLVFARPSEAAAPEGQWWNNNYLLRKKITITTTSAIAPGHTIGFTDDTATLISASQLRSDAKDWRVVWWNGSAWVELDRHVTVGTFNTASTETWFKAQAAIGATSSDDNYYLYYNYASEASSPPATLTDVYNPPVDGNTEVLWYGKDGTGTTLTDSSGNGRDRTLPVGWGWSGAHKFGGGFTMPNEIPSTKRIGSGFTPNVDTQDWTVEMWLTITDNNFGASTNDAMFWHTNRWNGFTQGIFWPTPTQMYAEINNAACRCDTTTTVNQGTTYHLAVTYEASTDLLRFYKDGALVGTSPARIASTTAQIQYGSDGSGDITLGATQEGLRVSNVRRTSFPYVVATEPTASLSIEATPIYRSVGITATALANGSGNSLTISGSTATFAVGLANNIGVGDAIQYDSDGNSTIDAIAFIHRRTSSTVYTVKNAAGDTPPSVVGDTDWGLFRAYTRLANWESQTENTNINATVRNFDTSTNLVSANTIMKVACYADGADTTVVTINGWTTGADNYIDIFTPHLPFEVGINQRHSGVWDATKYRLVASITFNPILLIQEEYVRVTGLQIENTAAKGNQPKGIRWDQASATAELRVSHNILRATGTGSGGIHTSAVQTHLNVGGDLKAWNNIIYDWGSGIFSEYAPNTSATLYNNTVINSDTVGINIDGNIAGTYRLANNLVQDASGFNYWFGAGVLPLDYSATNLSQDASSPDGASFQNLTVTFAGAGDFHLNSSDTNARDRGTGLSSDADLPFSDDIDVQSRPNGSDWDIGADEWWSAPLYRSVGITGTALASGGGNALTISGSTATFAVGLPDNIGVGDAIQYDSDGNSTIDAIAFIHGRTSSTVFTVKNAAGGTPTAVAGDADWGLFRAYTSLFNWEAQNENGNLDVAVRNFDTSTDLVTPDRAMMVAAYADGVDTTAVTINGWITGPNNYIKVFTPTSPSEVGTSQRHSGVWDTSKYRLEAANRPIVVSDENVRFEGLQIRMTSASSNGDAGILFFGASGVCDFRVSHSIIEGATSSTAWHSGLSIDTGAAGSVARFWNNIIYDFLDAVFGQGIHITDPDVTLYAYNNTVYNNGNGIIRDGAGTIIAKNNIAFNNNDDYAGSFNAASDNNLGEDAAFAGDANYVQTSQTAAQMFVDPAGSPRDLHILTTSDAYDAGADLSLDASLTFADDIDGQARGSAWDIGADEAAATVLYRSVGITASDLNTASRTVEIAGSTATFSGNMADNVGVGDVLVYNNGSNQLAFIHGRASSTVFTVKDKDGNAPAATAALTAVGVYRAYTSLNNWEIQTENGNINEPTENDVNPNPDLVATSTMLMVACYGDGVDTTAVRINGWTTGPDNYIKIYTPTNTQEVGTPQRHDGKWDTGKYRLEVAGSSGTYAIWIEEENVRLDGLQVYLTSPVSFAYTKAVNISNITGTTDLRISNSIIRGAGDSSFDGHSGIDVFNLTGTGTIKIWNNVIYDFRPAAIDNHGFIASSSTNITSYLYNNTVYDNSLGFNAVITGGTIIAKNNISYNNTDNYIGTFDGASTNNLSGPAQSDAPGSSPRNAVTVTFVNAAGDDFHLDPGDTGAQDWGANLSGDSNLAFTSDIDGSLRQVPWDIGADDVFALAPSNVTQSHYRWRNDDGNEAAASWSSAEDTPLTGLPKGAIRRLRFELSNEGIGSSGGVTYQLQVAETTNCGAGSYSAVPTDSSGHWQVISSAFLTDGEATTNVAGGLTDEATTFVAGEARDAGNTIGTITLDSDEFTEIEFAVQATSNATDSGSYCFRLVDAALGPIDTYSVYAEITVYGSLDLADHDAGQIPDQFAITTPATSELYRFKLTGTATVDNIRVHFTTTNGVVNGDVTVGELYRDNNNDGLIDGGDFQIQTGVTPTGGFLAFNSIGESPGAGTNYIVRATVSNLVAGDTTTFSMGTADIDEVEVGVTETGSASNVIHIQDSVSGGDVYYSVGTSRATATDLKTGSPTVTITNGTATFSVAQTGNIGLGDEINYGAGSLAYVKSVLSPTQFVVHAANGGVPVDVGGATVNSIMRAFATLSAAEANSGTGSYLGNFDLTGAGANANLTWVAYNDANIVDNLSISSYTTDSTHFITLTVAGAPQVASGVSQRHDGTAGTGVVLSPPAGNAHAIEILNPYTRIEWFEITGWSGSGQRGVEVAANQVTLEYLLIHDPVNNNAKDGIGVLSSLVPVDLTVRNSVIYNIYRAGVYTTNATGGNTQTLNLENVTVYQCGTGATNTRYAGITVCSVGASNTTIINAQNVLSINNGNNDFEMATGVCNGIESWGTSQYNMSSDGTAPGPSIVSDATDGAGNTATTVTDTTVDFVAAGVVAGDWFNNDTDGTSSRIQSVDSTTQLTLAESAGGNSKAYNISKSAMYRTEANIFKTPGSDFHLKPGSDAINVGTNLSGSFTGDIDDDTRGSAWDIGADELEAVAVYYSVGIDGGDLKTGSPTLDISNGVAAFSEPQPAIVGVGDVITYNGGTKAYIHGRTSAQVFSVRTATGIIPSNESGVTVDSVMRAFTSLSQAQTQSSDVSHLGTTDLVAGNFQLNWPCYDDGPMDDLLDLAGWTTGETNYIRIYTPVSPNEVGASQRHSGSAGTGFRLTPTDATIQAYVVIYVRTEYVRIEGIEVDGAGLTNAQSVRGINLLDGLSNVGDFRLDSSIIHDLHTTQGGRDFDGSFGVYAFQDTIDKGPPVLLTNNIIYDVTASISEDNHHIGGIHVSSRATSYVYNNTIFRIKNTGASPAGATWGIEVSSWPCCASGTATVIAKNNYVGDVSSDLDIENAYETNNGGVLMQSYNVSSDGTAVGTGSQTGQTSYVIYFRSISNGSEDLHLTANSNTLWGSDGEDLSAVFGHDVDGGLRTAPWDIGADEIEATTDVELLSFGAFGVDGAVELRWETASELDNLGFHLYRSLSQEGPYGRVTAGVIPGLGSSPQGAKYAYRDSGLTNGVTYFYQLEDIETTGVTELHGPVSATPSAEAAEEGGTEGEEGMGEEELGEFSSRITYGNPSANELLVRRRGKRWLELELITEGFYAVPQDDGSVLLEVPGFEDFGDVDAPDVPSYRTWVDAFAGRQVTLESVKVEDEAAFASLRPSESELMVVASEDGTVQAGRRRKRRKARHVYYPESWAELLSVGFQGAAKKAQVEMAPLRWNATTERLVLARRLVVRISFRGRDRAEVKLGKSHQELGSHANRNVLARLAVTEPGLYGVSFESVFGAKGKPVPTSDLRLSRQGEPVAFFVSPNARRFKRKSTLYFLSEGASVNPYGDEAVYELEWSSEGLQMAVVDGSPAGAPTSFYWKTVEREENLLYQPTFGAAEDIWQWDWVFGPMTKSYPFEVTNLSGVPESSSLRVWLHGASDFPEEPDHHVRVYVNGTLLTETWWDGETPHALEAELGPGILVEGANMVEIEEVGDTEALYSMVMLDRFEVSYPAELAAEDGELRGSFRSSGTATVSGLDSASFVFDTTEGARLTGVSVLDGGVSYRAESGHGYLAVSSGTVKTPEVRAAGSSVLKKAWNRAEYLVIGPRELLTAAAPLLTHRRQEGLIAGAIATEDIYDEFGYGEATPESIKDLVSYVYHHWSEPTLRYVVLLGDGTYDPKDYLDTGTQSRVPVKTQKTQFMWTASDPWYGEINGDDILPDVAVGRLPASSVEEVELLIQKILDYESGAGQPEAPIVLITDNPDIAGDFDADAEELASTVLAEQSVAKIYLTQLGTTGARSAIVHAFDEGASLISYMGHGAIHLWANENLFDIWDVPALSPQSQQPILLTMNCLNGYFHFPYHNSLSEELLKADGKGIIAAFSPSGLSLNSAAHRFHEAILGQVVGQGHERLGDAVLAGQAEYAESGAFPELLSIYHLLADPALNLR